MVKSCVYCPRTDNLTAEHAPPKLVFPEPRPNDLITVPACAQCNGEGSRDAEYFRLCLCFNPQAKNAPSVVALKPTVRRSLERDQAAGFRKAFMQSLTPFPDGVVAISIDMGRIHRVVRRVVQCLYLHETGTKLPTETHESRVMSLEMLATMESDMPQRLRSEVIEPLMNEPARVCAGNQFAYRVLHTGKEFVSMWALVFYGTLPFIGFTAPKVDPAP